MLSIEDLGPPRERFGSTPVVQRELQISPVTKQQLPPLPASQGAAPSTGLSPVSELMPD